MNSVFEIPIVQFVDCPFVLDRDTLQHSSQAHYTINNNQSQLRYVLQQKVDEQLPQVSMVYLQHFQHSIHAIHVHFSLTIVYFPVDMGIKGRENLGF